VHKAAEALGVTVDAVRGRIKRGTIQHERDGNRVYVILAADESGTGRDQPTDQYGESSALISQLRDENAYLRDENRRKDEILMQQAMTMRQLSVGPVAPAGATSRSPESVEHGPEAQEEPRPGAGEDREATRSPWWRRWFGP
jgi:hypothetical protein